MKSWSFYDAATGAINSRQLTCGEEQLAANTPAGHVAIEGQYDALQHRVDLASGAIVDYQPPQPDEHHQWNQQTRRWELTPEAAAAAQAHDLALARIQALEASQPRAIREVALGQDGARQRLAQIDAQIASQREQLLANPPRLKRGSPLT